MIIKSLLNTLNLIIDFTFFLSLNKLFRFLFQEVKCLSKVLTDISLALLTAITRSDLLYQYREESQTLRVSKLVQEAWEEQFSQQDWVHRWNFLSDLALIKQISFLIQYLVSDKNFLLLVEILFFLTNTTVKHACNVL